MNDYNLTQEDRAAYPLTYEAREAMAAISERAAAEAEEALKTASKLEKRALSIRLNMAKLTKTFLCFHYHRVPLTEQFAGNRRVLEREGLFDAFVGDRAAFDSLSDDERAEWMQFAEASFMLHRAFIDQHLARLDAAKRDSSPKAAGQIFESRIVLGTLYEILCAWRAWRADRGLFPFNRWTYEDEPWAEQEEDAGDGE
ncbi:MAG: hypothetical protein II889_07660 [Clostridia bacterium]|nr:hypothetical protein [Clostridia bacterium]